MNNDYIKQNDADKDNEIVDDTCDLDPTKICDNCGKCIETNVNYKIIKIDRIIKG